MLEKDQVAAARERALAVREDDRAVLVVTGTDRVAWLNGLLTCDLLKRAPGAAVYGLAVQRNGRVIADATVVFDEVGERLLVAVPDAVVGTLRAHLEHYLVMEDAAIGPNVDAFEVWALHGPHAEEALLAARRAGAIGGAIDPTGLGGAVVLAPEENARQVAAAIAGVATVGDSAGWDVLRLENAVPRFGVDFEDKTYPQEAALEKTAVSFEKGCYLGQEVVCMLQMRGHVKRKLVSVVLEATETPGARAPVTDATGAAVGEVTSAAPSPRLGKIVALAMMKRAQAEPGTEVVVGGFSGEVVARPA
jgi:folate-binding protein YgfZ